MCYNGKVPDYGVGEPGSIRATSIFFWGGVYKCGFFSCICFVFNLHWQCLFFMVNEVNIIVFFHYKRVTLLKLKKINEQESLIILKKKRKIMKFRLQRVNKRPMGHIAHLRKQFKSINTYDYIITLIKRRRKNIINFMRINWFFI